MKVLITKWIIHHKGENYSITQDLRNNRNLIRITDNTGKEDTNIIFERYLAKYYTITKKSAIMFLQLALGLDKE